MRDTRFVRDGPFLYTLLPTLFLLMWAGSITGQDQTTGTSGPEPPPTSQTTLSEAQTKNVRKLIARLSARSYSVRQKARKKLLKIGHPAVPLFKEHLSSDNPETRKQLLSILKKLGAWRAIPELAKERVRKYLTLLKKEKYFYEHDENLKFNSWSFKEQARNVFGPDAPEDPSEYLSSSMMNLILQQANRSNTKLMHNIAFLFRFGPPRTAASLLSRLTRTDQQKLQKIAFASLAHVLSDIEPPPHTRASIRRGLQQSDPTVRTEAVKLAGHLPAETIVPLLLDLLESKNADLRYQTYYSLRQVTGHNIYFNAWWDAERRRKTIQKWRTWWKNNRRGFIKENENGH